MQRYEDLTAEEKLIFSTQLESNPVLKHVLDKLAQKYLDEMGTLKASAAPHEIQGVFIAYKTAQRVGQEITKEVFTSREKQKTKK